MTDYTLFVRDATLELVAEVSDYARFECVKRFNDVSTWTLDLNADLGPAALIHAAVKAKEDIGVVLLADDRVILSGEVRQAALTRGGAEGTNLLALAGVDDTGLLAETLAFPVPAGPPYTSAEEDVRTGVASTVMRQYVDVNAAAGARTDRERFGLVLAADPSTGSTVTGRARFDLTVLDLLAQLARTDGLRFEIKQSATPNQREFIVAEPTDLSDTVIFSLELGNLREITRTDYYPSASFVVAGGDGEGTARLFSEDDSGTPTGQRVEMFVDKRGAADLTELNQNIAEALTAGAAVTTWDLDPIDTELTQYARDYDLGDVVTVVMDDETQASAYVAEVAIEFGGDDWSIKPALSILSGTLQRPEDAEPHRVNALSRRVANLEARSGGGSATVVDPPTSDAQLTAKSLIKAWATVSAAGSIIASYNVSSATDNGTGDLTITINRDFSTVGAVVASPLSTAVRITTVNATAAGSVQVKHYTDAGAAGGSTTTQMIATGVLV